MNASFSAPRLRMTVLVALVLAVTVVLLTSMMPRATSAAGSHTPKSIPDPRLVLHPHPINLSFSIAGKTGQITFSTSIPGPNAARLRLPRGMVAGDFVRLYARMPHMTMAPVRATLHRAGAVYAGGISFPMFGQYIVTVRMSGVSGRLSARMLVNLPLPKL